MFQQQMKTRSRDTLAVTSISAVFFVVSGTSRSALATGLVKSLLLLEFLRSTRIMVLVVGILAPRQGTGVYQREKLPEEPYRQVMSDYAS